MSFIPEDQEKYSSQKGSIEQDLNKTSNIEDIRIDPSATSSTASHQHKQEQEMLSSFSVPRPPVSTQQSSVAAEIEGGSNSGQNDSPRTLWMGDLDPWLDEKDIVDLWWQLMHSKVSVRLIKPKNTGMEINYQGLSHSGYCFVEFESFEEAQKALGLNGQLLPDIAIPSQRRANIPDNQKKYFRLNWASGATLNAPIVQSPEYSLFVGDLSASTNEAHLLAFFQKSFPTSIKTVRVMTDPVTGKSRCFGFVRFTEELERQRALVEMNGAWFGGRPLRVALATPRNNFRGRFQRSPNTFYTPESQHDLIYMPPPPPPMGSAYGYFGNPSIASNPYHSINSPHGGSANESEPPSSVENPSIPSSHSSNPPPNIQSYADPSNTTVFVGGLSSEVTEHTLFTLFKQFGLIQQVKIPPGKNCGFVKYATREEAEEAIASMQGFVIGGNRVRLSWGRASHGNKRFQQLQANQAMHIQPAAMPVGMDPAMAAVAAGFAPHMLGQIGGIPPIGIPHAYHVNVNSPGNNEDGDSNQFLDEQSYHQDPSGMHPYYVPIPMHDHTVAGQTDELTNSLANMNLGNGPDGAASMGYMVPPAMFGGYRQDLAYQQFAPPEDVSRDASNDEYGANGDSNPKKSDDYQ